MNSADSEDGGGERQRIRALEEEHRQLRIALESRIVIEQARGALSVTHGLMPDDAFELLRRQARSERRKVHLVAAEVVRNHGHFEVSRNGRIAPSPAPRPDGEVWAARPPSSAR